MQGKLVIVYSVDFPPKTLAGWAGWWWSLRSVAQLLDWVTAKVTGEVQEELKSISLSQSNSANAWGRTCYGMRVAITDDSPFLE